MIPSPDVIYSHVPHRPPASLGFTGFRVRVIAARGFLARAQDMEIEGIQAFTVVATLIYNLIH